MFNSLKDFQSSAMLLGQTFDAGVMFDKSLDYEWVSILDKIVQKSVKGKGISPILEGLFEKSASN